MHFRGSRGPAGCRPRGRPSEDEVAGVEVGELGAEHAHAGAARPLDEVRGRVARARAGGADGETAETEAGVRELLRGIGDPADLASEARRRYGRREPGASRRPGRRFEVIALVLLMIPFAGWATGVVLVWMSRVWSTRDKIIATIGGMSWVLAGLATLLPRGIPAAEPASATVDAGGGAVSDANGSSRRVLWRRRSWLWSAPGEPSPFREVARRQGPGRGSFDSSTGRLSNRGERVSAPDAFPHRQVARHERPRHA